MIAWFPGKRRKDHLTHARFIVHYIRPEEAKHGEPAAPEIVVAQLIIGSCNIRPMRNAVHLDDQLGVVASKVGVIRTKFHLLAEMITVSPERMQQMPHSDFG